MGEAKQRAELAKRAVVEAVGLETAGGRLQVHWDETAQATPHGQMASSSSFSLCRACSIAG